MYIQKIIFIIAFCIYSKLIFLNYKYVFAKIMIYSSRFIVFIWHEVECIFFNECWYVFVYYTYPILLVAFSLKTWTSTHGLSVGSSMDIHYVKQLFQDLGVGPYLLTTSEKCDWKKFPFKEVNASGWNHGNQNS